MQRKKNGLQSIKLIINDVFSKLEKIVLWYWVGLTG